MKLANFRVWVVVCVILSLAAILSSCVSTESLRSDSERRSAMSGAGGGGARGWEPLAADGVHDPKNPGLQLLQEPGISLSTLSSNRERLTVGSYATGGIIVNPDGNRVDWVQALRDELISPLRTRVPSETPIEREELVMDMDMFLDLNGSMPMVRFPHLAHTLWLACSNCHPDVFVPQSGANKFSMEKILSGEQCGICHRAVAFPPTDCARCHSLAHNSPEGKRVKVAARAKSHLKIEVMERVKKREKERSEAEATEKAAKASKSAKTSKATKATKGAKTAIPDKMQAKPGSKPPTGSPGVRP